MDYYKLFVIKDKESGSGGYSFSPKEKYSLLFFHQRIEDSVHEILHVLGLPHTFDGFNRNAMFTYQALMTNNVMDYTPNKACSLEQWQWQLINIKIIR